MKIKTSILSTASASLLALTIPTAGYAERFFEHDQKEACLTKAYGSDALQFHRGGALCAKPELIEKDFHYDRRYKRLRFLNTGQCVYLRGAEGARPSQIKPQEQTELRVGNHCAGKQAEFTLEPHKARGRSGDFFRIRHFSGMCVGRVAGESLPAYSTAVLTADCDDAWFHAGAVDSVDSQFGALAKRGGFPFRLRSLHHRRCWYPLQGKTDFNTPVVMRLGCDADDPVAAHTALMYFQFQPDGNLKHLASGRCVVPRNSGNLGRMLFLRETDCPPNAAKYQHDSQQMMLHSRGQCVVPQWRRKYKDGGAVALKLDDEQRCYGRGAQYELLPITPREAQHPLVRNALPPPPNAQ